MPVRPLPPALAEKAKKELNEDPQKLEEGIQHLKEWISKQPHLNARTDDQWLAAFLRGCKFSLERAKEKIDLFYSLKSVASELYPFPLNSPKLIELLKLGFVLPLPKTDKPDGPRVMILNMGKIDPNKYKMTETMYVTRAIQLISYMEDDNLVVAGAMNIMDMKGITMSHITQMTPGLMKKAIVSFQEAAPLRMKGAHYLNMPSSAEAIFNVARSLMNEKNRQRLVVHGKDPESLFKYVPKDILPAEYGGNGGTAQEIIDYWAKKFQEYSSWFEDEDKYRTDESKRPGKPKTAEEMFGVEGSFRQLQVD